MMKKIYLLSTVMLSCFLTLFTTACSDEYSEGVLNFTTTPRFLGTNKASLEFGANGGSENLEVITVAASWKVSCNASWVHLSANTGSETTKVGVVVDQNNKFSTSGRTAVIVLESNDGGSPITRNITVNQRSAALQLTVSEPHKIEFKAAASKASIKVDCNNEWKHTVTENNWLDVAATTTGLDLSTTENTSGANRTAYINVTSADSTVVLTVVQLADKVTMVSELKPFGYQASSQTVKITTETAWEAKTNDTAWLTISPASGKAGEHDIQVTVEANESTSEREGSFVIGRTSFTVKQGAIVLSATPAALTFKEAGETLNLQIKNNTGWEIKTEDDAAWLSFSKITGTADETITVKAEPNKGTLRNTVVTLQSVKYKSVSQKINISQDGSGISEINTLSTFAQTGGSTAFTPILHQAWTATVEKGVKWITISPASGDGETPLAISTVLNESAYERTSYVEIHYSNGSKYRVLVKQEGLAITADTKNVEISSRGGDSSPIVVESTGEVQVISSKTWVKGALTGKTLILTAEANNTTAERKATITLKLKGTNKSWTIEVTQKGATFVAANVIPLTVGNVTMNMNIVNGGTFEMGSSASGAFANEKPVHNVTLHGFYMGETEVTQELWYEVMKTYPGPYGAQATPATAGGQMPVSYVNFKDCQEFIGKMKDIVGYPLRMPTEAEWEYAARGGAKTKNYTYSGSNTIGGVAWYKDNTKAVNPVKKKTKNELGLYDMSGNVWEWCSDFYGAAYYNDSQNASNPLGPESGKFHVVRGGGWHGEATYCRVTNRDYSLPDSRSSVLGLRLTIGAPIIQKSCKLSFANGYSQKVNVSVTESELTKALGLTKAEIEQAFAEGKASIVPTAPDLKFGFNGTNGRFGGWFDDKNTPCSWADNGGHVYIEVNDDQYNWKCGLHAEKNVCAVGDEHAVNMLYQVYSEKRGWCYANVEVTFIIEK